MLLRRILAVMICAALAIGGVLTPAAANASLEETASTAILGDCAQPDSETSADCNDCDGSTQGNGLACDSCSGFHHCYADAILAAGLDDSAVTGGAYKDPLQIEAWALPASLSGPPRA